jgi:hypothetical protein
MHRSKNINTNQIGQAWPEISQVRKGAVDSFSSVELRTQKGRSSFKQQRSRHACGVCFISVLSVVYPQNSMPRLYLRGDFIFSLTTPSLLSTTHSTPISTVLPLLLSSISPHLSLFSFCILLHHSLKLLNLLSVGSHIKWMTISST